MRTGEPRLIHFVRRAIWEGRRIALRRSFNIWQWLGFHITPNHYYEPIPDTRRLPASLWARRMEAPGVDMREHEQVALLEEFASRFHKEYAALPLTSRDAKSGYYIGNGSFESVDGEILYCMIRQFRPKRIVEVGAGASTLLSAKAVLRNASEGNDCEFVSIDPFPPPQVRLGRDGLAALIAQPVQGVPLDVFTRLAENDILFIDSTHVLKIGSDVQYEFLEIIPRLAVGVLVHVHDIFIPAEYPRDWVLKNKRFWSEQYLLQAFLAFNQSFEVLWGASFMHQLHPEMLEAVIPSYRRDRWWPGSFWFRRVS